MVVGQDGRAILEVMNSANLESIGSASSGAVIVTSHPGLGGVVGIRDKGGKFGAQITGFPAIGV